MRHNLFRKKLKSSLILFVAGVLLVSTLFASAVNTHQAHAATMSAEKSAQMKQVYGALVTCLRDDGGSEGGIAIDPKSQFKISYSKANWGGYDVRSGYVESLVENRNDTASTNCGIALKNGNLSALLSITGITKEELYCNYDSNVSEAKDTYGIISPVRNIDGEINPCKDEIQSDNDLTLKSASGMREYIGKLFTDKVFGGDVPGGSLTSYTNLEAYYAYRDNFKHYCIQGNAHYGADADTTSYKIYDVNPSTGRVELVGYSIQGGRVNNNVGILNTVENNGNESWIERTCSNIASVLGDSNNEITKARIGEQSNGDKTACNETYDKEYNTVKEWVSSNGNSLDGNAEADVSTFLSEYNRNGADKWTLSSDGSITCTGLNTMASKWEEIKTRHGLTSAPTIDTTVKYTTSTEGGDDGGNGGVTATCHTKAGALGWLLCPVLEAVSDAANWAYTKVIVPRLKTEVKLFQVDGPRNGTYQAWQTFRDIANILFVILLLFVIFSQVSGFGIDNYGIKKTLPKLIVAAVLVNISFYICQGLIDISNIAGSGIYDLLTGISDKITIDGGGFFQANATSITVGVLEIVAVGVAGTVFAGAAFWSAIGAGIFALVPAILSAAVAILLLFVLLSMRQAVTLVLVALSPLAFVAYSLPNTKRLFDRWSNILRGMLLLYPIAALLMAGGRLASRIIFASGDGAASLELTIVAMLAEIVPLFLIPGITRSAYQATGALGAAINRWSARATAGTRNGVRNSQRFQRSSDRIRNFRAQQRTRGNRLLSGGRATARYQAAAAAVAAGTANRRQRMRAFLGRERAAAVNRAAQEAAQREGEKDAWAAANGQAVAEGARNKARIDTGQQIVSVADYANAQFANATIRKVNEEHDNKVQQTLQWNNEQYAAGKHNANAYAREQDERDTALWTDAGFIGGQMTQAEIARRAKAADTNLYNDAGFVSGMERQQDVERDNRVKQQIMWNSKEYREGREFANLEARRNDAARTTRYSDPNYREAVAAAREDRERTERENAIMAQITRNGSYGGRNFGAGGKDLDALMNRFVELSNQGDAATQEQQDERGAIFRRLASEKQGIALLNNSITGRRAPDGTVLSDEGLEAMNAHRIQNADAAAAMAKKDTVGSMYLDDVAAGHYGTSAARGGTGIRAANHTEMGEYTTRALSDATHIADQSGAALRRAAEYLPPEQVRSIVEHPNFEQIIPDAGNRETLIQTHHTQTQSRRGRQSRTYGSDTGNYFDAPSTADGRRWTYDSSSVAGTPILHHPDDPTRRYNANTNTFL